MLPRRPILIMSPSCLALHVMPSVLEEVLKLSPFIANVMVYGDDEVRLDALPPPAIARVEVIDELYAALRLGVPPLHNGPWAMATLEVCAAMLQSARDRCEIQLHHQTGLRPRGT